MSKAYMNSSDTDSEPPDPEYKRDMQDGERGIIRDKLDKDSEPLNYDKNIVRKESDIKPVSMLTEQIQTKSDAIGKDKDRVKMSTSKFLLPDLQIYHEKILGTGSFSKVFPGRYKGDMVAIKVISTSHLKDTIAQQLKRELQVIRVLQENPHLNIATYYKIFYTHDKMKMVIVMELCSGGELSKHIKVGIELNKVRDYYLQILDGYKHLLELNIVHRDIKSANVLLNEDMRTIKYIDFGLSKIFSVDLNQTICGSPLYMAPELLDHQHYNSKSDIWSLGVLLYEMVYGATPFYKCTDIKTLKNTIKSRSIVYPSKSVKNLYTVPPDLIRYLKHLLECDPLKRISWDELSDASWLKNSYESSLISDTDKKLILASSPTTLSSPTTPIISSPTFPIESPQLIPPKLSLSPASSITHVPHAEETIDALKKNITSTTIKTLKQIKMVSDHIDNESDVKNTEKPIRKKTRSLLSKLPRISNISKGKTCEDDVDRLLSEDDILIDKLDNSINSIINPTKSQSRSHSISQSNRSTHAISAPIPISQKSKSKKKITKMSELPESPGILESHDTEKFVVPYSSRGKKCDHNRQLYSDYSAASLPTSRRIHYIPRIGEFGHEISEPRTQRNRKDQRGQIEQEPDESVCETCERSKRTKSITPSSPGFRGESFVDVRSTELSISDISVIDNKYGDEMAPIIKHHQTKASASGLINLDEVNDLLITNVPERTTAYEYICENSSNLGSYLYSRSAPIASSLASGLSKAVRKTSGAITTIITSK